ncbi:MAG: 50S ribosomal protein L24 [Candidatus Pacearchaeota archaeon]
MKKKFSTKWLRSKQVRKQRKYRKNAPLHKKLKMMGAHLSKELRKKYGKRSLPLRKGDEVKILRGEFKKKTGKVSMVDIKKQFVIIEGIQRKKKEGTKVNVPFHPSNLLIQSLALEDKKRLNVVNRNGKKKGGGGK